VGGAAGLAGGIATLSLASRVAGTALSLRPGTALVSLAAAVVSGTLAGWYPARRAATIDVVSALRAD